MYKMKLIFKVKFCMVDALAGVNRDQVKRLRTSGPKLGHQPTNPDWKFDPNC